MEREEEKGDPDKQTFHLCIINLVIGTLYCAKGNFEFGISRWSRKHSPVGMRPVVMRGGVKWMASGSYPPPPPPIPHPPPHHKPCAPNPCLHLTTPG